VGDKSGRRCLYNIISLLWHVTVLVQKLGANVVDFVFETFVSIITSLGFVDNKTNLVDNPLSIKLCPLTVTPLPRFPKECFLLDCPGLGLS
jgi:hypothetical protein